MEEEHQKAKDREKELNNSFDELSEVRILYFLQLYQNYVVPVNTSKDMKDREKELEEEYQKAKDREKE